MKHIRIYDRTDPQRMLFDLPEVVRTNVTAPGVLVVDLVPRPGAASRLALAPGHWGVVAEWVDEPEQTPAPPAEAVVTETPATLSLAPPVVPGNLPTDADLRAFIDVIGSVNRAELPDTVRVHEAMQIPCMCDDIRCATILNPATEEEKKATRKRGHLLGRFNAGPPNQAEPLKRCCIERDHPTDLMCYWREGDWPYGVHNHHPRCPRNPRFYNRGEGQPSSAGITSTTATLSVPAPAAQPATTARPYITAMMDRPDRAPLTETDMDAGTAVMFPPYNWKAREADPNLCASLNPLYADGSIWCTENVHMDGGHRCVTNGGSIISW